MSARLTCLALILGAVAAVAAPAPQPAAAPGKGAVMAGGSQPVVTPTGSSVPLTPDQLKALDSSLAQAESIVLDLESIASGGVDGTGCPPSFTVRDYMQDLRSRRTSKETGDDIIDSDSTHKEDSGAKAEWQFFYACQALATRNPAACAEAGSVVPKTVNKNVDYKAGLQDPNAMPEDKALAMQQAQSYEGKCVNSFYQERARAAYVSKAANFVDVCRESLPHLAEVKDAPSAEAICRAWQSYSGTPEPFIAAMQSGLKNPLKREYALNVIREMTVAPGACAAQSRESARRMCREMEDFRSAFASKNKDACKNGICRVLMGDGQGACESYSKKFRAAACNQHYATTFASSREGTFKSVTDGIEKSLGASDAGIGDPKALKEFNARLDKLYDLKDRFTRASVKINPGSAKKSASAPAAGPKKGA